jgi:hypothetical protein
MIQNIFKYIKRYTVKIIGRAWWYRPINPRTQEAEAEESQVQSQRWLPREILS